MMAIGSKKPARQADTCLIGPSPVPDGNIASLDDPGVHPLAKDWPMSQLRNLERRARHSWQVCLGSGVVTFLAGGLVWATPVAATAWSQYVPGGLLVLGFFTSLVSGYVALTTDMIVEKRRKQASRTSDQ